MENKLVSDRLLDVWPNMEKIVRFWKKMPVSKQPSSKSFKNVAEAVDDPLTPARLAFFSYVSSLMEPYLTKYQSNKPMIPFMYLDLKDLIKKLLQIIIKPEEIEKCKTGASFKSIDFTDKQIFMDGKGMQMGFRVQQILGIITEKDLVASSKIVQFRDGAKNLNITLLEKLLDKRPKPSTVLHCSAIFDPVTMISL